MLRNEILLEILSDSGVSIPVSVRDRDTSGWTMSIAREKNSSFRTVPMATSAKTTVSMTRTSDFAVSVSDQLCVCVCVCVCVVLE